MMNDNFEKTHIDTVQLMESKIKALQREVADLKPLATKWTPQIASEMLDGGQECKITLHFGGKAQAIMVRTEAILATPLTDITSLVLDKLSETILESQLRDLVTGEIKKLQDTAKVLNKAGKW